MPKWPEDFPPIEGLKAAVERKLLPRPASNSPVLDRAVGNLTKLYPRDMADTTVDDLPWDDAHAGSSITGETDLNLGSHQRIGINPVWSRAFPQHAVESTIAHELEHARQNRQSSTFEDLVSAKHVEREKPYFERPSEVAARGASGKYYQDTGQKRPDVIETTNPNAFQSFLRVMRPPREDTTEEAIQRKLGLAGIRSTLE